MVIANVTTKDVAAENFRNQLFVFQQLQSVLFKGISS